MPYGEVRTVRSARRGGPGPPAGYVLGTHYYGDYVTPLIAEGMPLRVAWVAWWGRTFATTLAFGVCDLRPSVGSTACHRQNLVLSVCGYGDAPPVKALENNR